MIRSDINLVRIAIYSAIACALVATPVLFYSIDRTPPFTYISGSFPAGEALPDTDTDLDLVIDFHRADCVLALTRAFEDSAGRLFKEDKPVVIGPPPTPGRKQSVRPVHIPKRMASGRGRYLPYADLHCPGRNWIEALVNWMQPIYIGPPKFDIPIMIVPTP